MKVHRLAIVLAAATYVLLIAGGLVHGTDSGLACPDWPLCFGQVMPEMTGHVAYEHTHRLVATSVGILTLALAFAVHRSRRDDGGLRWLTLGAVALVVVQGVLGGLTVLFRLPDAVSTTHLGVSMIFFATTIYLALRTRPDGLPGPVQASSPARKLVRVTLALVYLQLLLGALVRHVDGAALVCHLDVVTCRGQLWPDWHWSAKLHMLHRFNAVAIAATAIALGVAAWRGLSGTVRAIALSTPALVVIQVALGVMSILRLLEVRTVTAHLGVGAALWGATVCLAILTRRAPVRAPT